MKRWTLLDTALTPDGRTVSLNEHDGSYAVRVDGITLMSTRKHASEEKIAQLACSHASRVRAARVLIGGLGFGFTLRAALSVLSADAQVVVVEILPAVVAWNRNLTGNGAAADSLADRRVTIVETDVVEVISQSRQCFDSIILDIDNGPAALSTERNDRLYQSEGLESARAALRPGGCVAFWSARPDLTFAKRMAAAGFDVDIERCRAHQNSGGWHTIFIGRIK